jgi:DNA-binding MarR family transcriptional regulator
MPTSENSRRTDKNGGAKQDEILLGVLTAVQREADISQRTISRELGVALGLANAYLGRCVRKGWIKVQQVPRRRYRYYLTAQGFAEKTRLMGEYLTTSFTFFRRARGQMSELMDQCGRKGWRRVAFVGVSDLAEIGIVCSIESTVELVGIIDEESKIDSFRGLPVFATVKECGPLDAVIITSLDKPLASYKKAVAEVDQSRILVPSMLQGAVSLFQAA